MYNIIKAFVFCGILFVLSGCMNNEPMPQLSYEAPEKIVPPRVLPPTRPSVKGDEGGYADWAPPSYLENKARWQGIIIHHSGTPYGNAAHEDQYHKSIGWDGLGYDFVINNGVYQKGYGNPDGLVEVGYRWHNQETGSHCRINGDASNYWNEHTIGICLIGNFNEGRPTERQMQSLAELVRFLQSRYHISTSQIKGHSDVKPTDCPGKYFPMSRLKSMLRG